MSRAEPHERFKEEKYAIRDRALIVNPKLFNDTFDGFIEVKGDMHTRLERDNIDSKKMDTFLCKWKGVIAGSYSLQVVLDKNYNGSDIDIWICSEEETAGDIDRDLREMGYKLSQVRTPGHIRNRFSALKQEVSRNPSMLETLKGKLEYAYTRIKEGYYQLRGIETVGSSEDWVDEEMEEENKDSLVEYLRLEAHVKNLSIYRAPDKPDIQIIQTLCSIASVILSFDIGACRVLYDGRGLYSHKTNLFNLDPKRLETSITAEASHLQSLLEWKRTQKRMIKYLRRGFTFNLTHMKDRLMEIIPSQNSKNIVCFIRSWNTDVVKVIGDHVFNQPVDISLPIFHNFYWVGRNGIQDEPRTTHPNHKLYEAYLKKYGLASEGFVIPFGYINKNPMFSVFLPCPWMEGMYSRNLLLLKEKVSIGGTKALILDRLIKKACISLIRVSRFGKAGPDIVNKIASYIYDFRWYDHTIQNNFFYMKTNYLTPL